MKFFLNIFLMSKYEQIITWEGVLLYWCITLRSFQGFKEYRKTGITTVVTMLFAKQCLH